MVKLEDAVEIISALENAGIKVFIDGGWGVDALLGYQSRAHNDIDIFIESSHKDSVLKILYANEYKEIKTDYTTSDHSVWKDKKDRLIDLHIFSCSPNLNFIFEGQEYPREVFSGKGKIGDIDVVCIPPEYQVQFHLGYERDINDIKDVLRKADELMKDVSNSTSLIDELTKKIDNAYVMLKRRYNVSPARMELLNRLYNNVS